MGGITKENLGGPDPPAGCYMPVTCGDVASGVRRMLDREPGRVAAPALGGVTGWCRRCRWGCAVATGATPDRGRRRASPRGPDHAEGRPAQSTKAPDGLFRQGPSPCARGDLNPYVRRHWNLNPARLPIPPLARRCRHEGIVVALLYRSGTGCGPAAAGATRRCPGRVAASRRDPWRARCTGPAPRRQPRRRRRWTG